MKTIKEIEERIKYLKIDLRGIQLDLESGYINDDYYNYINKKTNNEITVLEWVLS